MKTQYLFLMICLLSVSISQLVAQTQIWILDFESAGGYTTSQPECNDNATDYFARTNEASISATFTGETGSFFAAQDMDHNPCNGISPKSLTTSSNSISGYTGLEFRVDLAEDDDGSSQDWDEPDFVHFEYNIDGSGWNNLLWLENDGSTFNSAPFIDTDFDGTGDGAEITDAFTEYAVAIPGTGSNIQIRATISLNSGDEDIAIDNIEIYGSLASSPPTITSSLSESAPCGSAYSYFITATGGPTSYNATGLPTGLSINTSNGEISGTPTTPGTYNVTITATNGSGSDSENLVLTIEPEIEFSVSSATVSETGTSYNIQLTSGCTGSHTADVVVTGGSATNGTEYSFSTATASFAASTTYSTTVTILDNGTCDGNTNVSFGLSNFTNNGVAGSNNTLDLTINDDEQVSGQQLAFQGFEGSGWSYTSAGTVAGAYANSGSSGIRIGGSQTISLNSVPTSSASNILLTMKVASQGGIENADALEIYVNLDGSGFPVTPDITIQEGNTTDGFFNRSWNYSASGLATTTAGTPATFNGDGASGYATVEISIPNGTSTVAVNIESNNNNSNEYYYIDDIELTGDGCTTCNEPTVQTTLNLGAISSTTANLNWAAGTGSGRLTVVSTSPISDNPSDNSTYTANSIYGSGSTIGTDQYVVNAGPNGSVSVTGLTPGTQYYAKNWEYDCLAGSEDYLLTAAPTVDFVTEPNTPVGFTELCMRNTEIELSWSAPAGSYDGFLLVARQGANPHSVSGLDPSSQTFNLDYSSAPTFGSSAPNSRVLYRGASTSATVSGLTQGLDYTFEVLAYKIGVSDYAYSTGTTVTRTIEQSDVTAFVGQGLDQTASLSWANPDALCWDAIVIIASTSSVTHIPSGNGSIYTADTAYGSGYNPVGSEYVVYNGTGTTVDIGNLVNGTDYYFRAFTRSGTNWSSGNEIIVTPSEATILEKGDLAIVAVNTQHLSSGGDDEICFVAFKDLNTGTAIDFTDNGYERVNAGEWGDTEGVIRLTRTGGAISAGTTVCIQGEGNDDLDFDVYTCGVLDNSGWEITSLNSGLYNVNLNASNDPIWVMQGGSWVNPGGSHNATYVGGNILYGWTPAGWEASPGYASTSGSTLFPRMQCFTTDVQSSSFIDKVKYTGPMTLANRRDWISRFNDPTNWTGYSSNTNYYSGPNYDGSCISFSIDTASLADGYWYGDESSNWFDCSNWGNLSVPDSNTNVFIGPATVTHQPDVDDAATFSNDYDDLAETANLKILSGSLSASDSLDVISVHGDLFISDGATLDLDNGTGATLALFGDFIDSTNTGQGLLHTNSTLVLKGGGNHNFIPTDTPYTLHNLVADKSGSGVFTLQGPVLVENRFGLEHGIIATDPFNYLEIDSSGFILNFTLNAFSLADRGNENSFVDGPLRIRKPNGDSSRIFFPVGDNGVYSPIEIVPGTLLPQTYIGQYFNSGYGDYTLDMSQAPALNQVSQVEYWEMDGVSNAPGRKDLRMRLYCSASNALCNTYFGQDSLRVSHYRTDLSNWRLEALSHTEGTVSGWRYIESNGSFTTLSPFTFGVETEGNPLPVELVDFEVFPTNEGTARLEWITSLEINNDGFEIQRSKNGIEFETIGWVDGKGNSTVTNFYTAFDNSPYEGQSYYRLKQIDFDGTSAYSPIRTFYLEGEIDYSDFGVEAFPVPAKNQLFVNLMGNAEIYEIKIELISLLGQTVKEMQKTETTKRGFVLDVSDLPRGNYLLKVGSVDHFEVKQIQLQ